VRVDVSFSFREQSSVSRVRDPEPRSFLLPSSQKRLFSTILDLRLVVLLEAESPRGVSQSHCQLLYLQHLWSPRYLAESFIPRGLEPSSTLSIIVKRDTWGFWRTKSVIGGAEIDTFELASWGGKLLAFAHFGIYNFLMCTVIDTYLPLWDDMGRRTGLLGVKLIDLNAVPTKTVTTKTTATKTATVTTAATAATATTSTTQAPRGLCDSCAMIKYWSSVLSQNGK
jgi:hypothetical protein